MQQETIKASEFKAKCLSLMDEVARTGESITITKNGKPLAQLTPVKKKPKTVFGMHRDVIDIAGDIVSPAVSEEEWNKSLRRRFKDYF